MSGVEEAFLHWSGKSFKHKLLVCGKQDHLENLENLVYEYTSPIIGAKHNQHAKHAYVRGIWGHAPQEKFEK